MIHFLRGILVSRVADSPTGASLVVDVNGMGYLVLTHSRAALSSPPLGQEITLHTQMVVREDAMTLVGFIQREERDLFAILQQASGVGVRVALALLGELSVADVVHAVISEDYKPLTLAKGVGPKLAQKMVLELKEKMLAWKDTTREFSLGEAASQGEGLALLAHQSFVEAETVLLSLGYGPEEVMTSLKAVHQQVVDPNNSEAKATPPNSETVLRESLRWLSRV